MEYKLKTYLSYFRNDFPAGLVVFLVALPLCLGIAFGSGAPPFAGIISGVVGGIIIGSLSGSQMSVSGPAAGLITIVSAAILDLGYEQFLTAVVLAGLMQLILGYLKAGVIGLFVPSSVIRGMLAAIGIMMIMSQIPHFLGVDKDSFGEIDWFSSADGSFVSKLGYALTHIHTGAMLVGFCSLALMIIWDLPVLKRLKFFSFFPGALAGVLVGIGINELLIPETSKMHIGFEHLVKLPMLSSAEAFGEAFRHPDLAGLLNYKVFITAITLAIVASLESLLSIEAVDKLDPLKRRSSTNKELKAQGIGNMVSGLIGGLPITAVIVRSSANVAAGGRTKMSAVYHGILLSGAVLLIPTLLNKIPLASLAALLLIVGYKLTKPALYRSQYRIGKKQFVPFIVTVVSILFTNLLVGILIGMSVGVFYLLRDMNKVPFFEDDVLSEKGDGKLEVKIQLKEHITFLNKAALQARLEELPDGAMVIIDGTNSHTIDHDVLEVIYDFRQKSKDRGIAIYMKDIPHIAESVGAH